MTLRTQEVFDFQGIGRRKVTADFKGGFLSSDGGGLLLRELESKSRLLKELSECFTDVRNQAYVEHSPEELVKQRVFGLLLGYEDLNDHDKLRLDPLQALFVGKNDPLGLNRRHRERDEGKALAGASTLNRMELSTQNMDSRYKKLQGNPEKITQLLIRRGVQAIPRRSSEIILDFDATDDPLHGAQEGAFYHGYYKSYCYLPLYCFCGNIPLWAELRAADQDASNGTVEALEKIVPVIRQRFGRNMRIVVRGDSGFARNPIMAWCEDNDVEYCLGLARNARLQKELSGTFHQLEQQIESGECEVPARLFHDFEYRTRKSWSQTRRVIGKAEILRKGANPRFIVTNIKQEKAAARELYEELYCGRGDMENRIKEQQLDLFADRTSSHSFETNQLRLWFSAFAHLMMSEFRASLSGTKLAGATIGQLRLKLFKIAARVTVSVRRFHIELVSACPWSEEFSEAHRHLRSAPT